MHTVHEGTRRAARKSLSAVHLVHWSARSPIIIAVLGQPTATFPRSDDATVVLHIDDLGVLDIGKKNLSIDATIYDSRIVKYDSSSDSALRLSWGSKPVFTMSLGGFHPKFSPPPNFAKLRRLALELSSSNSFGLRCTVYHALTSNSLQLGAKLQLHAEACGAALDGHLSFDGVVTFSPFSFEVGISSSSSASYKAHDISSLHLSLELSGPTPVAIGLALLALLACYLPALRVLGIDPAEAVARRLSRAPAW